MKTCTICTSEVTSFKAPPEHCSTVHNHKKNPAEGACHECWELWLSQEVEEQPASNVRCMFCLEPLGQKAADLEEQLKKLSRQGTFERYKKKHKPDTTRQCIDRCLYKQKEHSEHQSYIRERDGRIFTCARCSVQVCTDCDRPEHFGETCEQYRSRFCERCDCYAHNDQTCEEYQAHQKRIGFRPSSKSRKYIDKTFNHCPECGVVFELAKGCGYVQCIGDNVIKGNTRKGETKEIVYRLDQYGCRHRFCSICLVPWVPWRGEDSVYASGRLAHKVDCKHYFRFCSEVNGREQGCNRHEHPGETCAEYEVRVKPIQDAKDPKHRAAAGEKHWETSWAPKNRFEQTETSKERAAAKKERSKKPSGSAGCTSKLPAPIEGQHSEAMGDFGCSSMSQRPIADLADCAVDVKQELQGEEDVEVKVEEEAKVKVEEDVKVKIEEAVPVVGVKVEPEIPGIKRELVLHEAEYLQPKRIKVE